MTMEKQTAEVQTPKTERKSFGMRSILLTSWASVATALLLLVLIGGAIYINDVRSDCDQEGVEGNSKTDRYDDGVDREDVYTDDNLKSQLFINRNKDGAITLIADVDYNRKISAVYVAETDQCLLSAGEDLDWYEAWNAPQLNVSASARKDAISIYEEPDLDNRVTDLSLVPTYMRPFCQGKEIYWTKQVHELEESSRHKRGAPGYAVYYCHRIAPGVYCCHYIGSIGAQGQAGPAGAA